MKKVGTQADATSRINNINKRNIQSSGPLDLITEKGWNRSLWRLIHLLKNGGATKAEAFQVVRTLNNRCTLPVSDADLSSRLERAYVHQESEAINLSARIKSWIEDLIVTPGVTFSVTQCDSELGIVTPSDKTNRRQVLARLSKQGLIEPTGRRSGVYRIIDHSEEVIDWVNATNGAGLPIRWPLELEGRFEMTPGSVAVVAGESNSGKTAFMLNLAWLNLASFRTFYFSSSNETNAHTLRKRILLFGDPVESWQRMTAISRPGEFQDVIRPDALNLIDYLEVHQDFYEVGGMIAAIAEKLRDGLAVIAIQKNPGADFGRGGAMTLDKASAYLALHQGDIEAHEPHTLKLPKIKYPLVDYAQKPIRFKLVQGHRFVRQK